MKKFKIIGIISLLMFSFYLTDFVTELAIYSNPLMKTITHKSKNYCTESVNATIENNTIIPGIKGKKVNEMESYLNMKDFGIFNYNYLIYDSIEPEISLDNNIDKIIISGNKQKRQVSIIINNNQKIIKYNDNKKIVFTKLVKIQDELKYKENINIESDKKKFNDLNTLLNKNNLNKKICLLNFSNIELCKTNKYYIIKPNIVINNNNFIEELNNINNGSIILIDDYLSLNNYKILLNYLDNKDLKKEYLDKLIEE